MPEGDEARRNDPYGITHIHHLYETKFMGIILLVWEMSETWFQIHDFGTIDCIWIGIKLVRYNRDTAGMEVYRNTLYPIIGCRNQYFPGWKNKGDDLKKWRSMQNQEWPT